MHQVHQTHQKHQTHVVFAAREDGNALLVFCAILFFIGQGKRGEVGKGVQRNVGVE